MPIGLHTAELNFETIKEIGQEGRNSQVFLAHDKQLDAQIVVKRIEKASFTDVEEYYKEAKILYASQHPNVVAVNYGCADSEYIYIAMPFYANGSLKKLIDQRFLTVREVIRYSLQFLAGLNNIHSKGLLHLDIKPDNILLSDSNDALLSDFGLSKFMDNSGFASQDKIYCRQIPPEAFSSTNKTILFDIYLAGLTIYRMLNGNEHFEKQFVFKDKEEYINAICKGKFPNRKSYLSHVPEKVRRIINKAMDPNLSNRYQSVLEFMNALSSIEDNIDWIYTTNNNVEKWTQNYDNRIMEIELTRNASSMLNINAYKTMKGSGTRTKIHNHTHVDLSSDNYRTQLKSAFEEL